MLPILSVSLVGPSNDMCSSLGHDSGQYPSYVCHCLQIKCLENENELLEKNENNLKESMEVLLQSREAFIKHYEAGRTLLVLCNGQSR